MANRSVARRYARAFIELAAEQGVVEEIDQELTRVGAAFRGESAPLYEVLANPIFTLQERRAILGDLLPRLDLRDLTQHLLQLILEKGRFDLLHEISEVYTTYADERAGRARVLVTTAEPLTPQLEAEVRAALEQVTGKQVLMDTRVDPDLIGGMIARVGDKVFDASVHTRLQNIKQRLLSGHVPAEA